MSPTCICLFAWSSFLSLALVGKRSGEVGERWEEWGLGLGAGRSVGVGDAFGRGERVEARPRGAREMQIAEYTYILYNTYLYILCTLCLVRLHTYRTCTRRNQDFHSSCSARQDRIEGAPWRSMALAIDWIG